MLKNISISLFLLLLVFVGGLLFIFVSGGWQKPKYTQVVYGMDEKDLLELCGDPEGDLIIDNRERGGERRISYDRMENRMASGCYGTFYFSNGDKLTEISR